MIASIDRYAGYVTALQEAGRMPDPNLAIHSDFTRRGGYRAMSELLAGPVQPDAVFVASDTMASGVLQALRDATMKVPGEMAVFGFDGLEEIQISQPILSTVVQPIAELGQQAVRALLSLLESSSSTPIQQFLPTRLSIRRSCGCHIESPLAEIGVRQEVNGSYLSS